MEPEWKKKRQVIWNRSLRKKLCKKTRVDIGITSSDRERSDSEWWSDDVKHLITEETKET